MTRKLKPLLGLLCHQLDDRTHTVCNEKLFVCARCLGTYFGFIYSFILLILMYGFFWADVYFPWIVVFFVPMAYDGLTQLFKFRTSTNRIRLITGYIAGVGLAYMFYAALSIGIFPGTALYILPTIASFLVFSGLPIIWYLVERPVSSKIVNNVLNYTVLVSSIMMFAFLFYLWFKLMLRQFPFG